MHCECSENHEISLSKQIQVTIVSLVATRSIQGCAESEEYHTHSHLRAVSPINLKQSPAGSWELKETREP